MRVKQAGYVPPGFKVRTRIDDYLFSAECKSEESLNLARKDPRVVSVEIARPMRPA